MTKTDPKMIINLNISDEEFEKKIKLAVDKYIESILDSCAGEKVNEAIKKYVDKKIDAILAERRYDNTSLINGKYLKDHIADVARPKVNAVVSDAIAEAVSEVINSKFKS